MAQYFAGNTLAAFFRTSTAIVEATTASSYDTYVDGAVKVPASSLTDYIESYSFSATGMVWMRFDIYSSANGAINGQGATLMNGTTGVFRISMPSNSTGQAQYWNGSAWTNTGSTFALTLTTRSVITARVDLGSGFEIWINGTSIMTGSGWSGGGTTVTSFRGYPFANTGTGSHYSQVMVADYDLRDSHLMTAAINGNSGSNTSGTGAYTDINEAVLDESTSIILASVGKKGQTKASITVPVGLGISAMSIAARGRVSGGTITDGKLGIRSGGTNYSSTGRAYNGGYEPRGYIQQSDPATGGAWTQTSFNNAEIYEEAV